MSDAQAWFRAADPNRRVGHSVEFWDEVGSTNDRARAALTERGGEGRAVVADRQSAGRGRLGRSWLSPAGANLLVSVAIRPDRLAPIDGWQLGAAAALAVRDAAGPWADLAIRWPNDLVTAEGLKVAGVLLETAALGERLTEAVIGVGINLNWRRADMPREIAAAATSLAEIHGTPVDRVELLRRLLAALDHEVAAVEAGASPLERMRVASWLTGRTVEVETPAGVLTGTAVGLGTDGGLEVEGPARRTTITTGEVIRVRELATGQSGL